MPGSDAKPQKLTSAVPKPTSCGQKCAEKITWSRSIDRLRQFFGAEPSESSLASDQALHAEIPTRELEAGKVAVLSDAKRPSN